ncbi:MAG: SpoIIE family protein phosphatase [Treponema sp.]|nr:SpoIIE family protein phosphatase [Treponema sp.]
MLSSAIRRKTNANLEIFTGNILAQINHLDVIMESTKQTLNDKHIAIARTVAVILEGRNFRITPAELKELSLQLDIIELNIADSRGNIINSSIPEYIGDSYTATETTSIYMVLTEGTVKEISEEPRASILHDLSQGEITHFTGVSLSNGGFIQAGFNADVIGRLQEQINIEKIINETKIGDNGFGFLISGGKIISHPDIYENGKDVTEEDWFKRLSGSSGFVWIEINEERYYAGYKSDNKNIVVGLVPYYDYYRELNRILIETIRVLLFSLTVMFITAFLIIGKLLKPIKHLVYGLGRIAESRLDTRIEGNYNDEFDHIKDAVNSMAEKLKEHMNLVSGIEYAGKIQRNLLPLDDTFKKAFTDYSCIWKPKDIVGGDIYWLKNFNDGTVLCVCDCTGHGTPGALLTMLVVSAFETLIDDSNYKDTAQIIWELEKKLIAELNVSSKRASKGLVINDGCDLAVLYISKKGAVKISSGNTNVFICDGKNIQRLRGQKLRVGSGALINKEQIDVTVIEENPNNKFYIVSDGLYEQIGSQLDSQFGNDELLPFGFKILEKIILENHNESQSVISEKIYIEFENHRGNNARRDDLQLITFKP